MKVQPGVLRRGGDDPERLHPSLLELAFHLPELRDLPSAEGAPKAEKESQEHGCPAAIIRERDRFVPVHPGEHEIRRRLSWSDWGARSSHFHHCLLVCRREQPNRETAEP